MPQNSNRGYVVTSPGSVWGGGYGREQKRKQNGCGGQNLRLGLKPTTGIAKTSMISYVFCIGEKKRTIKRAQESGVVY